MGRRSQFASISEPSSTSTAPSVSAGRCGAACLALRRTRASAPATRRLDLPSGDCDRAAIALFLEVPFSVARQLRTRAGLKRNGYGGGSTQTLALQIL
eukprot:6662395-Pyramimonas_sp.AAC.1